MKDKKDFRENAGKLLGYFLLKNTNDGLNIKGYIDLMRFAARFQFNVCSLILLLIYSRMVYPCSKYRTFNEIISRLFEQCDFPLNQIYSGLEYIGAEYERITQIYNLREDLNFDFSVYRNAKRLYNHSIILYFRGG